jgi:hypothetical protein
VISSSAILSRNIISMLTAGTFSQEWHSMRLGNCFYVCLKTLKSLKTTKRKIDRSIGVGLVV